MLDFLAPYVAPIAVKAIGSIIGRAFQPNLRQDTETYSRYLQAAMDQYYQPIIEQGVQKIRDFYEQEKAKRLKDVAARGIYSGGAIENMLTETVDKEREKAIGDFMSQIQSAKADMIGKALLQHQQQQYALQNLEINRGFDIQDYLTSALSEAAMAQLYPYSVANAAKIYQNNQVINDLYNNLMASITRGTNAMNLTNPFNASAPKGLALQAPIK
ncbi:MAG: hypothetical protein ACUVQP_03660 [Bacteroidales bacterium]